MKISLLSPFSLFMFFTLKFITMDFFNFYLVKSTAVLCSLVSVSSYRISVHLYIFDSYQQKFAWKGFRQRELNCFVFVLQLHAALWLVSLLPSGTWWRAGLHTQLIEEQQACSAGHMWGWGLGTSRPRRQGPCTINCSDLEWLNKLLYICNITFVQTEHLFWNGVNCQEYGLFPVSC